MTERTETPQGDPVVESNELIFQLSQADEQIVRSYECTRLKRWFRPPTIGRLTVTNKRIVYHSTGKSLTGKSLLINEMPLEDVSGLTVYDGSAINFLGLLLSAVGAVLFTALIARLRFLSHPALIVLFLLPYAVLWLFSSDVLNPEMRENIFASLEGIAQDHFKIKRDLSGYLSYVAIPFYLGLALLAWRISLWLRGSGMGFVGWVLLIGVYGFVFTRYSGRKHTYSLLVGSRAAKGSGIFIPGDTFRMLISRDTTAIQSMFAGPAKDTTTVSRELGALVLDIQQLGDMGIQKWQEMEAS